jgi:membrane protease YdiL (CAAX protease family)
MSDGNNNKKFCPHCGSKIDVDKIYCPECGKVTPKVKAESKVQKGFSRKCPNCGSIINSRVLKQCPVCDTELEEPPKIPLKQKEKPKGLVFTDKKFVSEEKLTLKKDIWNFREGINVFGNSILTYVTVTLILYLTLSFYFGEQIPTNIYTLYLFLIPDILFSVYIIYYIISNNHKLEKLGLSSNTTKILIGIGIGILGAFGIYLIDYFSDIFLNFFASLGFSDLINDLRAVILAQNQTIRSANPVMIIIFTILLCLSSISSEIVFRGVLHNALKQKLGKDLTSRFLVILLVASVYSIIYLIFSIPSGLFYIISNFLISMLLGLIYEINGNLYSTIFANIFYNIAVVIIIAVI